MANVSRVSDIWVGICCCHKDPDCIPMGGYIITGSPNSESSTLSGGRVSDMVIGYCGHPGKIITGSGSNITNSLGKAVSGSMVTGCTIGKVVTGNPIHNTGL